MVKQITSKLEILAKSREVQRKLAKADGSAFFPVDGTILSDSRMEDDIITNQSQVIEGACDEPVHLRGGSPVVGQKRAHSPLSYGKTSEHPSVRQRMSIDREPLSVNGEQAHDDRLENRSYEASLFVPDKQDPPTRPITSILAKISKLQPCYFHPTTPFGIIFATRGSSASGPKDIEFELDEEQMASIASWVKPHSIFECVTDFILPRILTHCFFSKDACLSITLMCARTSGIKELTKEDCEISKDELTRKMTIEWPNDDGLYITVQAGDSPGVSFKISPPSMVTAL
jgi:hypothetical protein